MERQSAVLIRRELMLEVVRSAGDSYQIPRVVGSMTSRTGHVVSIAISRLASMIVELKRHIIDHVIV